MSRCPPNVSISKKSSIKSETITSAWTNKTGQWIMALLSTHGFRPSVKWLKVAFPMLTVLPSNNAVNFCNSQKNQSQTISKHSFQLNKTKIQTQTPIKRTISCSPESCTQGKQTLIQHWKLTLAFSRASESRFFLASSSWCIALAWSPIFLSSVFNGSSSKPFSAISNASGINFKASAALAPRKYACTKKMFPGNQNLPNLIPEWKAPLFHRKLACSLIQRVLMNWLAGVVRHNMWFTRLTLEKPEQCTNSKRPMYH